MDTKTKVMRTAVHLVGAVTLVGALAGVLTGCTSKADIMHAEGRVDSARILYTCNTLPQKQLAIQQFNACYMMAPKTEKNRKACEETARSLACDRLLDDGSNPALSLTQ